MTSKLNPAVEAVVDGLYQFRSDITPREVSELKQALAAASVRVVDDALLWRLARQVLSMTDTTVSPKFAVDICIAMRAVLDGEREGEE